MNIKSVFFIPTMGAKNSHCENSGAEDEIRTRDVHLGKVTLYH